MPGQQVAADIRRDRQTPGQRALHLARVERRTHPPQPQQVEADLALLLVGETLDQCDDAVLVDVDVVEFGVEAVQVNLPVDGAEL